MTVTFYNNSDDERVVDKTLTSPLDLSCEFYDACSIIKPKLLLEYNATIFSKNYCYISAFNRYYFINNITTDAGERIIVDCFIDVLNTYKTNIKALNATVRRNEFADNSMLVDPAATFSAKRVIEVYAFSNTPFNIRTADDNNHNFVLVVGGGYGS